MAIQAASVFSSKVDERFSHESQVAAFLDNSFKFTGVGTVHVYSIPTVPLTNYDRNGANDATTAVHRYGIPANLGTVKQDLTLNQDKAFTFIIDKADKLQTQLVLDAGKALSREVREVIIPAFDAHVFSVAATAASAVGNTSATSITIDNAYSELLNAQEALGNANVPDSGRLLYCSYKFANLLKQSDNFMQGGNLSQEMLNRGIIGEVDGCKVFKVPASRLPTGADFLLFHSSCVIAPKQLVDYKVHDDPPGINGWLVEGRILYGAFVLNNKRSAIYYHGTAVGG